MKKFKILIEQFNSPLIFILLLACFVSFALGEYVDGVIILIVILMNGIIGFVQQIKAENSLDSLRKLSSPHCNILIDDKIVNILADKIKVGDILYLQEGDVIAADAIIIESSSLMVDEASLTGESLLNQKKVNDRIFKSTIVVAGKASARVISIGEDTEFGKISKELSKKKEHTLLQKKLNDLSKLLGIITLCVCLMIMLLCLLKGNALLETIITSVSLAVAAIPEGLIAVVTITLSIGVQKLINVKVIVRNLTSVETLGAISVVCSDKTGTITENKMTVEKIYYNDKEIMFKTMCLCNNSTLLKGDPTEIALIKYASKYVDYKEIVNSTKRIKEIPFTSENKMMSVICDDGITYSKGASEIILARCSYYFSNKTIMILDERKKEEYLLKLNEYFNKSLRVLCFSVNIDNKEIFVGFVGEKDPLKRGVKQSIENLKRAGIKICMITGDHIKTAYSIGKEINLIHDENEICLGEEINDIDNKKLLNIGVFARVKPMKKMYIVSKFKEENQVVAMTGDGVNDAPSLKEADIGIAMGKKGTEVAKDVSDIIIMDDNFVTIENAIKYGRIIYDNIKKAIIFLLSSNVAEILIMLLCLLLNLPLPLCAIHILWINLISDSLPALALGSDKETRDVMKDKPRKKESSILSGGGLKTMIEYGIVITLATFISFIIYPLFHSINVSNDFIAFINNIGCSLKNEQIFIKSQTLAFSTLSLIEIFHMIGMSDQKASVFEILKKKNYLMFAIVFISVVLQIILVQVPFFSNIFKITSLDFMEWMFVLILSISPLIYHELKVK